MNPDPRFMNNVPHGLPKVENPLSISWHDSSWIPLLNTNNVMDYFSERTNPFYDRTCNNESLKMQRLGAEHLGNMVGLEYCLLHVQEPILYVIRKQHRHSPSQVTPMADYYILAGVVYQAPDLSSVIGSRMLTMVHHLQSAFDEASSYSHYHPSKGYWWEFKDNEKKEKTKTKEEPGSAFQRRRVDILLSELAKKFPPKLPSPPQLEKQTTAEETVAVTVKVEPKDEIKIKTEKADTPPAATTTVSSTTVTTSTPTITTATPSLPPPPPPPPPAPTTSTLGQVARNVMKPPPEKKMRLV
ncbi:mediator of RNA polymerase II transcription subunit 6 [Trichonephila inaurata madagascariensis]|uniref:Mediator of RNA polymerase II transcription subunit 6 n=1 Tax=Trichonephila inaurata madagascariensis TaxID=2747483 RepID=A0A8X6XRC5_9ARAC|nr:mediator of RNA polymerase II transcription subunit 6 [Trichonephila inaurata madagascariensis]